MVPSCFNVEEAIKTTELPCSVWTRGSVVVKALCYTPEGRGFETG
jgi:hypothetical protein